MAFGKGRQTHPTAPGIFKRGVFAEPTSPEWREVVSGPKPKNFHKAKHAASPVSVFNRFEALQDEPTHEFVSVLRQACVDGMASHEAELIQVVEKLEVPPDSLVFWAAEQAIEQLAVNRSDPEACLDAIEDSFKQPQGVRPFSDLNILVANVTRWRMEVRTWAQERQPDVIMIQETHVTEKQQLSMQHEMAQAGYLSWALPAHPTQGGNNMGGIIVAAHSDRNFRLLRTFGVEGKGYLAVVGRVGKKGHCHGHRLSGDGGWPAWGGKPDSDGGPDSFHQRPFS